MKAKIQKTALELIWDARMSAEGQSEQVPVEKEKQEDHGRVAGNLIIVTTILNTNYRSHEEMITSVKSLEVALKLNGTGNYLVYEDGFLEHGLDHNLPTRVLTMDFSGLKHSYLARYTLEREAREQFMITDIGVFDPIWGGKEFLIQVLRGRFRRLFNLDPKTTEELEVKRLFADRLRDDEEQD